jgi:pilus assembly protein CpaC
LPGAGEVPVLGALFRSTNFQQDRTELVFVVTPRLVKPLPANYTLPTDRFGDVNEAGVLLMGNMEGKAPHTPPPAAGAPQSALPPTSPAAGNANVAVPVAPAVPTAPPAATTPVAVTTPVATALPDGVPDHGVMLPVNTAKAP